VGHWILADGYVLDTANNEITLQIGHFTTFGIANRQERLESLYLPIVVR
jgi:hypothetical protein